LPDLVIRLGLPDNCSLDLTFSTVLDAHFLDTFPSGYRAVSVRSTARTGTVHRTEISGSAEQARIISRVSQRSLG
jgi:hypothetical protein